MSLGDLGKKATDFIRSGKGQEALKSEKAEGVSDKLLDGVGGFADKVTGGKHAEQIKKGRDAADKQIGNQ